MTIISYEISRYLASINATRKYSTSYKESITTPIYISTGLPIIPINPWFITGFTDAEGCFLLQVRNRNSSWYVEARFDISLHRKDLELLERIKIYFGGAGGINTHGKDSYQYTISSIEQINDRVIPHFDNYPLITQKHSDYLLFKEAINLINSKKNMDKEVFIPPPQ